jgi:hypothetical protein
MVATPDYAVLCLGIDTKMGDHVLALLGLVLNSGGQKEAHPRIEIDSVDGL